MGALKINVSSVDGQSWPLVLHQTLNQNSTGWGPGIKFLNASDSSSKWAGIGGIATGGYANTNDLYFYTSATARYGMGSDAFVPLADNTYNLGQSALRWKRLYATKITASSAELNGYRALTAGNGGFVALDRDEMGTTYNIDALTTNSFFEVRGTNEVTLSGIRPFEGYYGCVNFHLPVCKMQIAGSNYTGFAIRGVQKAGATLENRDWHTLLTNNNYSNYALPLSGGTVTGTIILSHNYPFRFTNVGNNESYLAADSSGLYLAVYGSNNRGKAVHLETYDAGIYHRRSDTGTNYEILTAANYSNWACPSSGSNRYMKVYNSNEVVGSDTVTVNDLAKQGFAAAMIHSGAEDHPMGRNGWIHAISMSWGTGAANNWISQLAFGVQWSDGLWYRTNQSSCVGQPWKRVLDSSNYNSYSPTLTGGGASGTWGININGASALVYNGTAWGGHYADGDTHILQLGYFQVSSEYQSWVLCISSSFWGNQHSSSDFITVQSDTNGGFGYSTSRVKIGGKTKRTFYLYKDATNNRLYLYVAVYGGNSYGYWDASLLNSRYASSWVGTAQFNATLPSGSIEISEESFKPHTPSFGANQPSGSAPVGTVYYQTIG